MTSAAVTNEWATPEHATAYLVKDRGLVVIDSCARAPLWNGMSMALQHCPGEGSGEST